MSKKLTTEEYVQKAKQVHNDKYTYEYTVYHGAAEPVIITCPIHGNFIKNRAADHTNSKEGCPECGKERRTQKNLSNTGEFIEKAKKVHQDRYEYDRTIYTKAKGKVLIKCKIHGYFKQQALTHLQGSGCQKCRYINTGWTHTLWEEKSKTSSQFDGYKLYVVRMYDGEETFYKIGKTFVPVSTRLQSNPYHYTVIGTIEGDAKTISELEVKYHNLNKDYKYSPALSFSGHTECYTKVKFKGCLYD